MTYGPLEGVTDKLVLVPHGRTSLGLVLTVESVSFYTGGVFSGPTMKIIAENGYLTPDWADATRVSLRFGSEFVINFRDYFAQTQTGAVNGAWLTSDGGMPFVLPEVTFLPSGNLAAIKASSCAMGDLIRYPVVPYAELSIQVPGWLLRFIIDRNRVKMNGGSPWRTILRWMTLVSRGTTETWNSSMLTKMLSRPSK